MHILKILAIIVSVALVYFALGVFLVHLIDRYHSAKEGPSTSVSAAEEKQNAMFGAFLSVIWPFVLLIIILMYTWEFVNFIILFLFRTTISFYETILPK